MKAISKAIIDFLSETISTALSETLFEIVS
jgi:hypothetical protein